MAEPIAANTKEVLDGQYSFSNSAGPPFMPGVVEVNIGYHDVLLTVNQKREEEFLN
jgi:hypothetical protein